MPIYTAPVKDMQFLLQDVLALPTSDIPGYCDLDAGFTSAVLEEAGKLASEVLAPLNITGDRAHCRLENGVVRTPEGFQQAFAAVKEGGWTALDFPEEYGGQGLPYIMGTAVGEIFVSANMAFNMYQGLTHGAVSAILAHGTDRAAIELRLADDPFVAEQVVQAEIIEIAPSRADDRLAFLAA